MVKSRTSNRNNQPRRRRVTAISSAEGDTIIPFTDQREAPISYGAPSSQARINSANNTTDGTNVTDSNNIDAYNILIRTTDIILTLLAIVVAIYCVTSVGIAELGTYRKFFRHIPPENVIENMEQITWRLAN